MICKLHGRTRHSASIEADATGEHGKADDKTSTTQTGDTAPLSGALPMGRRRRQREPVCWLLTHGLTGSTGGRAAAAP